MHGCPPPQTDIQQWLEDTRASTGNYGHLLLEQRQAFDFTLLPDALRPYFESAHDDARNVFHEYIGIDLHPDATAEGSHAQYPNCLPPTTRKGLFGEVMIGLIAQCYSLASRNWQIPVYLFRYHEDVGEYLFALSREPGRTRQLFGRKGNDFIAIELDNTGNVVQFMAGEAKWRASLTAGVINDLMLGKWEPDPTNPGAQKRSGNGVWGEINQGLPVPSGLRQLQKILIELAPTEYGNAIISLEGVISLRGNRSAAIPRHDLVFIIGNRPARRNRGTALIPSTALPSEYTAGRPLQVVEVVLDNADGLIESLYDSLWTARDDDAAA